MTIDSVTSLHPMCTFTTIQDVNSVFRQISPCSTSVQLLLVGGERSRAWASARRGKWGQLTLWKNEWKTKKRKHAKRAVFYVYVIFWEQSGQADVENGAMMTTYSFRYTSQMHHFVVKYSKFSSPQAATWGHWPTNRNPADVPGRVCRRYWSRLAYCAAASDAVHRLFPPRPPDHPPTAQCARPLSLSCPLMDAISHGVSCCAISRFPAWQKKPNTGPTYKNLFRANIKAAGIFYWSS